jgi:hypothetical protein
MRKKSENTSLNEKKISMDVDLIDQVRFGSELTKKLVQHKSFMIENEKNND